MRILSSKTINKGYKVNQTEITTLINNFKPDNDVLPQLTLIFKKICATLHQGIFFLGHKFRNLKKNNNIFKIYKGIEHCKLNKIDTLVVIYTPLDFIEVYCRHYLSNNSNFYNIMYTTLGKECFLIDEYHLGI